MLGDVSYPETPVILRDLDLTWNQSVQHLRAAAGRRIRFESSTLQSKLGSPKISCLQNLPGSQEPGRFWSCHGTTRRIAVSLSSLCRHLNFQNVSLSDLATVEFLVVFDGVPLSQLSLEGVTLKGVGR